LLADFTRSSEVNTWISTPSRLTLGWSSGGDVEDLQRRLNGAGAALTVDGRYGPATARAVRAFQLSHDLSEDGVVGPATWQALLGPVDPTTIRPEPETSQQPSPEPPEPTREPTGEPTPEAPSPAARAAELFGRLDTLPRGKQMPAAVRAELYDATEFLTLDQLRVAFAHRFAQPLVDGTAPWTVDLARAVWRELDRLPDDHVAENTVLKAFQLVTGTGGTGPSWEAPTVQNTISIGSANSPTALTHTVLHEVGHAVHADGRYTATVNTWLEKEVGFWPFEDGAGGLQEWVQALGGFGTADSARVTEMLESYLGGGSRWEPSRPAVEERPEDAAVWAGVPEAVRNAVAQSTANWHNNWSNFQAGPGGSKYFLCYWYGRPYRMGSAASAAVSAIGDPYSAMSEKEFFANCYAEFFEDPLGFADPSRWGGSLPAATKAFFRTNILERQPYAPPGPAAPTDAPPKPTGMPGTP
ncbi:MAG: peptidoglycan-binding domain-containing protein, partial [Myxococcota bacterium]